MPKKGILIMIGVPKQDRSSRAADGAGGMKESGFMPDMDDGMADHGGSSDATACVPIGSVSADGTPPEVGDKVDFSLEGNVTSIKNGMAYVDIDTINGEAVNDEDDTGEGEPEQGSDVLPGASAGKESLAAMGQRLRQKAASANY